MCDCDRAFTPLLDGEVSLGGYNLTGFTGSELELGVRAESKTVAVFVRRANRRRQTPNSLKVLQKRSTPIERARTRLVITLS